MPQAICSSSEMKQGMFWSRASRAIAHSIPFGPHPITRSDLPRWCGEPRLERRASPAPCRRPRRPRWSGSSVEPHRFHFAQENEVGRAATAVDHFGSVNLTALRGQRRLHEHRGQPDAAGDQEVGRIGARAPGSSSRADPKCRFLLQAAPARAERCLDRPFWPESRLDRPGPTDIKENARGSSGSRPQAPRIITNCPGLADASDSQPTSCRTK